MTQAQGTAICWFRNDLRLGDHPALAAASRHEHLIPIYIDESNPDPWTPGGASRWWLHHSLESLQAEFTQRDLQLIIARGLAKDILLQLIKDHQVKAIYWNRRYDPAGIERDKDLKKLLQDYVQVESLPGTHLIEPMKNTKVDGTPYQVYTAYWRALTQSSAILKPCETPRYIPKLPKVVTSLRIDDLNLRPRIPWDKEFSTLSKPGEKHARERWAQFLKSNIKDYNTLRDQPMLDGTSRLGAHLHFGEISPRALWKDIEDSFGPIAKLKNPNLIQFCKELVWREFTHHLLFHFPHCIDQPLRRDFEKLPWRHEINELKAWQKGLTGYPIVDAGMRQLWRTGWMHNRVRMVVGSFLTKDLLIHWREGAQWFWNTLVDADLANNTFGWQWISGCGADAAPYFRVFNPVLQGQKFDPEGQYVKTWVPELEKLPTKWIHNPWEAPSAVLDACGIELGVHYPEPMVDHGRAKVRAMRAYDSIKN